MPKLDLYEHFQETKRQLLNHLDRDFWQPYLDFDALDSVSLSEAFTQMEYFRISALLNEATQCAAIHHVIKNASVWSENCD